MKFRSQISLLQFLALAASLLWLSTAIARGKPIKVEGIFPNVAAPSEELTVVISGSGFNDNDSVEFFFTGEAEILENSEISVVSSSKSNGRGTELTVKIKVENRAEELSYDIVVSSNRGRGKGTDLFSVSVDETPVKYAAALISGGFRFIAEGLTLNKRGNIFNSTSELDMDRDLVPDDQDPMLIGEQEAWDGVFATCSLFNDENGVPRTVNSVHVSANWSIDNSGGKKAGTLGSNIWISFRDVVPGAFLPAVDVDFSLFGILTELHPVDVGESSYTTLTRFNFFGDTKFAGCKSSGDLPGNESVLVITRTQ